MKKLFMFGLVLIMVLAGVIGAFAHGDEYDVPCHGVCLTDESGSIIGYYATKENLGKEEMFRNARIPGPAETPENHKNSILRVEVCCTDYVYYTFWYWHVREGSSYKCNVERTRESRCPVCQQRVETFETTYLSHFAGDGKYPGCWQ